MNNTDEHIWAVLSCPGDKAGETLLKTIARGALIYEDTDAGCLLYRDTKYHGNVQIAYENGHGDSIGITAVLYDDRCWAEALAVSLNTSRFIKEEAAKQCAEVRHTLSKVVAQSDLLQRALSASTANQKASVTAAVTFASLYAGELGTRWVHESLPQTSNSHTTANIVPTSQVNGKSRIIVAPKKNWWVEENAENKKVPEEVSAAKRLSEGMDGHELLAGKSHYKLDFANKGVCDRVLHAFIRSFGLVIGGATGQSYTTPGAAAYNESKLTTILLQGNSISDLGASVLAPLLAGCPLLTLVDLRDNTITKRGVESLHSALLLNPHITSVTIRNHQSANETTAEGVSLQLIGQRSTNGTKGSSTANVIIDLRNNKTVPMSQPLEIDFENRKKSISAMLGGSNIGTQMIAENLHGGGLSRKNRRPISHKGRHKNLLGVGRNSHTSNIHNGRVDAKGGLSLEAAMAEVDELLNLTKVVLNPVTHTQQKDKSIGVRVDSQGMREGGELANGNATHHTHNQSDGVMNGDAQHLQVEVAVDAEGVEIAPGSRITYGAPPVSFSHPTQSSQALPADAIESVQVVDPSLVTKTVDTHPQEHALDSQTGVLAGGVGRGREQEDVSEDRKEGGVPSPKKRRKVRPRRKISVGNGIFVYESDTSPVRGGCVAEDILMNTGMRKSGSANDLVEQNSPNEKKVDTSIGVGALTSARITSLISVLRQRHQIQKDVQDNKAPSLMKHHHTTTSAPALSNTNISNNKNINSKQQPPTHPAKKKIMRPSSANSTTLEKRRKDSYLSTNNVGVDGKAHDSLNSSTMTPVGIKATFLDSVGFLGGRPPEKSVNLKDSKKANNNRL